jgi:hypothetical protein
MISALHLIWIIPVSAMCGFILAALFRASGDDKYDPHDWEGW